MLLGQEGGDTIPLTTQAGDVVITAENSDDVGYSDITVSLCAKNLSRMILCNNVIEVVLECKSSFISYEQNDTPICEIISPEKDNNEQADAIAIAICLNPESAPVFVAIPYSEPVFKEINKDRAELKLPPLVNQLSITGIPNKTLRSDKTSFWSFKFPVDSIVNKKDGTIYELQNELMKGIAEPIPDTKRFLSFFPTANKFILKFKNVKIKDKIAQSKLTVKIKISNDERRPGVSNKPGKTLITDLLKMPPVGGTYDFDYSASNAAVINKSGDTPKHSTVVNTFLTRCSDIIDIKHVQLIFMFFYLVSQKSVKFALCGSKVDLANKNPECTVEFFKAIALKPFLNFLPVVYKSIIKLPIMDSLSFQDIIAKMIQTAADSGIAIDFNYVGDVERAKKKAADAAAAAKASTVVAPPVVQVNAAADAAAAAKASTVVAPPVVQVNAAADAAAADAATRVLVGGYVSNYQTGGGEDEDIFKIISRIIPMQIDKFEATPQSMTVTITRPKIMGPYCLDQGDTPETSKENTITLNIDKFKAGNHVKTKKYISNSLLKGQVTISVGDVVQFVSDGHVVKAIVCFFKSGKFKYGEDGTGYEAASNIRDYYASMKRTGIYEAISQKESEPLNLISLINLRGFAYLPIDDDGNILYDCKSKLLQLNNGYRPKNKMSQSVISFGRLLTPGSTEFRVGDIQDILFNTESLMTLIKADQTEPDLLKITDMQKIKDFAKFLREDDMGNSADDVIVEKIQKYIQQNGLSKQCGKSSSPNANDVKRMNFFQHKCQEINTRFIAADIYDDTTKQYNVYKSNEFIRFLLTEKISDSDSTVLFENVYKPEVPELIFWLFTGVASSIGMIRAMIMIFQAFARKDETTSFDPTTLLADDKKPGQEKPGVASFTVTVQGGGGAEGLEMAMGQSGGKWIKGVQEPVNDGQKPTGNYEWYDDISGATYEDENGNPIYSSTLPATEKVAERTSADVISGYIERLIAIIRINNLSNDNYLKFLTSQLRAAKQTYQSTGVDNMHLFSSSIATQHQAEAIMEAHQVTAKDKNEQAMKERETARRSAIYESEAAKDREAARQARIAEASNGKGTTASRNPFDLRSIFNQKSGSNINNELGTCISGNNAVISCDGKTIRIDLDLAALLSTCGDNIAPADDDAAKVAEAKAAADAKAAAAAEAEQERLNAAAAAAAEAEEEARAAEKERLKQENAAAGARAGAAPVLLPKPSPSPPPPGAAQTDATAKYDAYKGEYDKFTKDPIYKYLDYDAEYGKFINDAGFLVDGSV